VHTRSLQTRAHWPKLSGLFDLSQHADGHAESQISISVGGMAEDSFSADNLRVWERDQGVYMVDCRMCAVEYNLMY